MASFRPARKQGVGTERTTLHSACRRFDTTTPVGYSQPDSMDVKCEQCSAEYEFDESLLGEKGTTVKCSSCGHVFRVMPRRESGKGALRLRHVRTGQVETLATLRDLQLKIHAGEVTLDDQLGREGFPYRRLGDVPELKNFFGPRVGAAPSSMRADAGTPLPNQPLRVSENSMPPSNDQPPASRPQGGRTVLGVGPQNPQFPPAPRVPNIHGQGPAPAAPREPSEGRFGSEAPTAARSRPDLASLSQAPTVPGVSPSELMGMTGPRPSAGVPFNPPSNNPGVRLYLADDEAPPARATEGSKVWIYLVAAAVIGGGAWLAMAAFSKKEEPVAVAPEAARVEAPTPSPDVLPTPAEQAAGQPAPGTSPSTADLAKPADKPVVTTPEPKPEPASASGAKDKDRSDKSKDKEPSSSGSSGESGADPKDYGGWVAKGDKAFQRGDLPGARKAYESALALRGTGSEANTGLGFTLLGEGKASEAIPHFDRAAGSGYADAHIGLGDAYRRLGQKPAAIEAYKDYLERLPGGSKVSYVKRQLETLAGGAAKTEEAEENEQPSAPPAGDDYRPAGEMEQGSP